MSPFTKWSSVWHSPAARSSTSTSPCRGGSSSIGSTDHSVPPSHKIAASLSIGAPLVSGVRVPGGELDPLDLGAARELPDALVVVAREDQGFVRRGDPPNPSHRRVRLLLAPHRRRPSPGEIALVPVHRV